MFKHLDWFDAFLLRHITTFSHWSERNIGYSNFYYAWVAFGVSFCAIVMDFWLTLTLIHDQSIFTYLFGPVLIIGSAGMIVFAQMTDQDKGAPGSLTHSALLSVTKDTSRRVFILFGIAFISSSLLPLTLGDTFGLEDTRLLARGIIAFTTGIALYFLSVKRPPYDMYQPKESDGVVKIR